MDAIDFIPVNALEVALLRAMRRDIDTATFLRVFVESDVFIPSAAEVHADGSGMDPVLYDKDGVYMVAIYTDRERLREVSDTARYCVQMRGRSLFDRFPPDFGIVVNPGFAAGLDISPEGIKSIRREFAGRQAE